MVHKILHKKTCTLGSNSKRKTRNKKPNNDRFKFLSRKQNEDATLQNLCTEAKNTVKETLQIAIYRQNGETKH